MPNRGRSYALLSILTLQAFGLTQQAVALYGTRTYMYRCMLLGDCVYFNCAGELVITDRETWDARWVNGVWVHNG